MFKISQILQQALDEIDEVGIDPKKVWLKASLTWFPSFNDAFDHYYTTDSYTKNNKSFTWTLFDEVGLMSHRSQLWESDV